MYDHTGPDTAHGVTLSAASRSVRLAAELLDVVNESELEDVVGRLVAEAARGSGRRLRSVAQRALAAELRSTAMRTLPTLQDALGAQTRAPAAETAARLFGAELEGMSPEDRDFEIARQLVR